MSYKNMTNNDVIEEEYSKTFKWSECNESKNKYFIHMNIDNMDKYVLYYKQLIINEEKFI